MLRWSSNDYMMIIILMMCRWYGLHACEMSTWYRVYTYEISTWYGLYTREIHTRETWRWYVLLLVRCNLGLIVGKLMQIYVNWYKLGYIDQNLGTFMQTDANWANFMKIGVHWWKSMEIGVNWCKLGHIDANCCSLMQYVVNWCNFWQIWAILRKFRGKLMEIGATS